MHRLRGPIEEAGWIVVERKAPRPTAPACNSSRGNAAIGGEAPRIVDATSKAVHYRPSIPASVIGPLAGVDIGSRGRAWARRACSTRR